MNIGKYLQMYSEDLKLKNYSENTIKNYVSQVELFLKYFNKTATKPSEISEKQIKQWLVLAKTTNSMKHRISAVKLFYKLLEQEKEYQDEINKTLAGKSGLSFQPGLLTIKYQKNELKEPIKEAREELAILAKLIDESNKKLLEL